MAERNASGDWVRAALWLLVVLVIGAYGFAYAVGERIGSHAQDSSQHPNKEYLDERFRNVDQKLADLSDQLKEFRASLDRRGTRRGDR